MAVVGATNGKSEDYFSVYLVDTTLRSRAVFCVAQETREPGFIVYVSGLGARGSMLFAICALHLLLFLFLRALFLAFLLPMLTTGEFTD